MSFLSKISLPALAALCLATPLAAQATSFTFTGTGTSGTDPLASNGWTAGPNEFGFSTFVEPLVDNQDPVFEGGHGLTYATSLTFTYTGTDPNGFNHQLGSGLTHVAFPQGSTWKTTYLSPTTVEFTAPAGDRLNIGDTFDVQVAFKKAITADNFSFTATWSDGLSAVPEPATWATMLGGFGLVGAGMRRRRSQAAAA